MNQRIVLLVSGIALLTLAGCSGGDHKATAVKDQPIPVTLGTTGGAAGDAILASGQIEAVQTANISTRMMGRITSITVKAGDVVRKGQVLATISDEDMQAKRAQTAAMIAEAEAAFAAVQKDFDRFTNLYKQQSATARELDQVTMQYQAAKSRVEAARQMKNEVNAMMAYSTLTAPFDGVVTQKLAETGNIASPGMPLLILEQRTELQVGASIAESDISQIHLGDTAQILVKSTGKRFTGKVAQLTPSSQFSGGQYLVKFSIPQASRSDLYAGMYVNVSLPAKMKSAATDRGSVLVPQSALVHRDELTGIYTVSNQQTAVLRWLRTGRQIGNEVEVLSGLAAGESFITQADGKLYNGAPVQVKK